MKNLKQLKRTFACLGLILAASTLGRTARAEVVLVEKDGWRFSFDGRVNAILSVGVGDDFPVATPNASTMMDAPSGLRVSSRPVRSADTTGSARHLSNVVHGWEMPNPMRSPTASGCPAGTVR